MNRPRIALCLGCVLALAAVVLFSTPVTAHGGGLDSIGGHRDTKNGDYHVHQGTCAGRTFASKEAAIAAGCTR